MNITDKKRSFASKRLRLCLVFGLIGVICLNTGCQAILATVLLMTGGNLTKAKYPFFKGKKVAVVCLAERMTDSRYDDVPRDLSKAIGLHLAQNVKKIEIITPAKVNRYLDRHDNKIEDFQQFGKDMEADMVLVVYLDSFETSSLTSPGSYQGRAATSFTVYETSSGSAIATESLPEYVYPPNSRMLSTEIRESEFKKRYLIQLSRTISCFFYSYDHRENMAMDAHSELGL